MAKDIGERDYGISASRESFGIAELSEMWACSTKHVGKLIDEGCLEAINPALTPKTRRRVSRAALIKFLVARTVRPGEKKRKPKPAKPKRKNDKNR